MACDISCERSHAKMTPQEKWGGHQYSPIHGYAKYTILLLFSTVNVINAVKYNTEPPPEKTVQVCFFLINQKHYKLSTKRNTLYSCTHAR